LSEVEKRATAAPGDKSTSTASLRELITTLLAAVILAFLVRTFVVESFVVQGVSMLPTFLNNEHVLVDKLAYKLGAPQDGQVIVFHPPIQGVTEDYIKRVIGTPGQTVQIIAGHLYVDGKKVAQPYIEYWDPTSFHKVTVPKGDVFVMGDNRPDSYDSRYFGMVPIHSIAGQAILAFWPLDRLGAVGQPQRGARGYKA